MAACPPYVLDSVQPVMLHKLYNVACTMQSVNVTQSFDISRPIQHTGFVCLFVCLPVTFYWQCFFSCMKLHEIVKITEQHTYGEESIIYGGMHVFIINSKLYF